MPLIKSKSKAAFQSNVNEMIKAGHPKDQSLAAAYSIKEKKALGGMMQDSKMIDELMRKRRQKMMAEGGEAYDYDLIDQDESPAKHERPSSAKMNNTEPNLQEQSRHDMGDNDDSILDHKLSAEGRPSEREEALYADGGPVDPDKAKEAQDSMRKAFKFKSGGKVTSGPHASKKLAYGHGLSESEQQDEPRLHDEDSDIAMAEGGIAYNANLKENYQDDTAEEHDEDSSIAYAQGGTVQGAKHLEDNDEDTRESKDEASSIAMAAGGSVEHAKRLEDDMHDTAESHDEDSSIAMARGGDIAYTDIDEHDQEDTPEQLNEMDMAEGGQIEDDQRSGMNPKSMQNEDAEERAMKKRRRKHMIAALNE